jgi:hypothetical protein
VEETVFRGYQLERALYSTCLLQAEARAEFAEKTVKKLQKEVDRLEGKCVMLPVVLSHTNYQIYTVKYLLGWHHWSSLFG